jgi:hypothetical protein
MRTPFGSDGGCHTTSTESCTTSSKCICCTAPGTAGRISAIFIVKNNLPTVFQRAYLDRDTPRPVARLRKAQNGNIIRRILSQIRHRRRFALNVIRWHLLSYGDLAAARCHVAVRPRLDLVTQIYAGYHLLWWWLEIDTDRCRIDYVHLYGGRGGRSHWSIRIMVFTFFRI